MIKQYLSSSIGRKQVVAVSGLMLVLFLIAHLAGNLTIFGGPELLNAYSAKLHSFGPILKILEYGLTLVFLVHIIFTIFVVKDNRKARPVGYKGSQAYKERSIATKLMPLTGTIILVYLVLHLLDFTFANEFGPSSFVNGQHMGLYGLVYNAFLSPVRVAWYVAAMISLGLHLVHAVQSVLQTFGLNHEYYTPIVKKISVVFGTVIAIAYSILPVYVWCLSCCTK